MKKNFLFSRFVQSVTTLFLTGIVVLLPITLTVALISFSFRMLLRWLEPLKKITDSTPLLKSIPHPEVIVAISIILAAGIIYNVFLIRTIIHALEYIVSRIPIVRQVYAGFKQLVHAFSMHDKLSFKRVVIVEFPRKGVLSVGFLTSDFDTALFEEKNEFSHKKLFNVFIPTTPNPTTGFFVLVPEEQIMKTDISRQEAMAMIISGGIIQPTSKENLPKHKQHHA